MNWEMLVPGLIRPQALWLWLLLPLLLWWSRRRTSAGGWETVVDAHLLDAQLDPGHGRSRWHSVLPALAWLVAVLALAGPSWGSAAVMLERRHAPLVVTVELSDVLHQSDVAPTRLLRLRDKLRQLLDNRRDGAVSLVVYGGDAYTVVPLTDDVANVALFVDALSPEVMPVAGRDLGRALRWSGGLLADAGQAGGQVLVLASHADTAAVEAASALRSAGVPVSVIGVGPAAGWDMGALSQVAASGGGGFALLSGDTADLAQAGVLSDGHQGHAGTGQRQQQQRDDGPWLLPLVLLLLLPSLRRGGGWLAVLLALPLLMPLPAQAADGGWWQRADQQAHVRMAEGVAAYRQGDFTAAEAAFRQQDDAVGHYNLGNALARQGRLGEALAAYDQALARQPGMEDAVANRQAVLAALQRQDKNNHQQQDRKKPQGGQGPQEQETPGQPKPDPGSGGPTPSGQPGTPDSGRETPPPGPSGERKGTDPAASPQPPPRPAQPPSEADSTDDQTGLASGQPGEPDAAARQRLHEGWLQRVPDDPAALLRQKLRMEQARRQWQQR